MLARHPDWLALAEIVGGIVVFCGAIALLHRRAWAHKLFIALCLVALAVVASSGAAALQLMEHVRNSGFPLDPDIERFQQLVQIGSVGQVVMHGLVVLFVFARLCSARIRPEFQPHPA